ncbi:MAG: 3,4-dehydroadipyl-CoA semialdehyde dehydrogenase [Deltaproteobacteria bacterium]|nr:3,4-dehydroadipyl-CoA semialdehyde dehydrogenase [Deltaproteobacteria bacterium]
MAKQLGSWVSGAWVAGKGKPAQLVNPTTEGVLAETSTEGVDMARALAFARDVGGPALRAMSFKERGALVRKLSRAIHEKRDELIALGVQNAGNTRSDAKFDVDGASITLGAYADLAEELGDAKVLVDGEPINLGRSSKLAAQHAYFPLHGAAVHVNAFNFPAWGLAEKAAVALLAGMPVITKPATSTALMSHRIMELFVEQQLLPAGALSFLCGSAGDLISHLRGQDVLAFTGSGDTGAQLRGMKNVVAGAVRVNVEADSLNAAILGADVESGTDTFDLFVKDVVRDATQKAGQKCTAIRRVFVPAARLDEVRDALADRLSQAKVGDPSREDVLVGPLATKKQQEDVLAMIDRFAKAGCKVVVGGGKPKEALGVEAGKGFFVAPTLLEVAAIDAVADVHEHEIFGPCTTLIPYESTDALIAAVRRGGGGLVASLYSDDKALVRDVVYGIASSHGRLVLGNEKVAGSAVPPGTVMAQLVHGGPGRAGGGEELGGIRGMELYLQRVALQGYGPLVASLVEGGKRV